MAGQGIDQDARGARPAEVVLGGLAGSSYFRWMAWNDARLRNLYCLDHLVGQVWDTHAALVGTHGSFRLITEDSALLEFLADWELIHPNFMEGGALTHDAAMAAFLIGVGEEVFEETAWRLEDPQDKNGALWLWGPPVIDFELGQISMKVHWDFQPD